MTLRACATSWTNGGNGCHTPPARWPPHHAELGTAGLASRRYLDLVKGGKGVAGGDPGRRRCCAWQRLHRNRRRHHQRRHHRWLDRQASMGIAPRGQRHLPPRRRSVLRRPCRGTQPARW